MTDFRFNAYFPEFLTPKIEAVFIPFLLIEWLVE